MDKDRFLETGLLEQYVLGLADEEESRKVEQYAEAFPEIQAEINSMREAVEHYAQQYAVMPPEELKARVMNEIDELETDKPNSGKPASKSLSGWMAMASLAAIALLAVLALSFYKGKQSANEQYRQLSKEFLALQENCARQQEEKEELQQIFAFLKDQKTIPVHLKGTQLAPESGAVAYLNKEYKTVYLNPANLPAPPAGKTYQMWADVDGKMINLGLVDAHTENLQAFRLVSGAESLNITLEPEGGSEEPTVELLYANGKV